jgi:hypothetical protein
LTYLQLTQVHCTQRHTDTCSFSQGNDGDHHPHDDADDDDDNDDDDDHDDDDDDFLGCCFSHGKVDLP